MRFVYEIFRASDSTHIAEGETLHVVTDKNKKVRSLPAAYKEMLLKTDEKDEQAFPANQAPS
jgi:acyl-CoA thioesterase FadM